MVGIPFTIRRTSSELGVQDEVVYLRSRRRGEAGESMRRHIRDYHAALFTQMQSAAKAGRLSGQVTEGAAVEVLEQVDADLGATLATAGAAGDRALEHAEHVARLALQENYGERAAELLDGLTDKELHAIVSTVEVGQMPADFFGRPDTPPKPSATGPSGTLPAKPS
jgi:hypothetical protein